MDLVVGLVAVWVGVGILLLAGSGTLIVGVGLLISLSAVGVTLLGWVCVAIARMLARFLPITERPHAP